MSEVPLGCGPHRKVASFGFHLISIIEQIFGCINRNKMTYGLLFCFAVQDLRLFPHPPLIAALGVGRFYRIAAQRSRMTRIPHCLCL